MIYRKSQIGWIIIGIFITAIILICLTYLNQWGSNSFTTVTFLISLVLFAVIISLFYKLTIEIDGSIIKVIYGIGIIKIKIKVDKLLKIESIKTPWYYGLGIRFTPKGLLYNIHGSKAVLIDFTSKGQSKSMMIGTAEPQKLTRALEEAFKMGT